MRVPYSCTYGVHAKLAGLRVCHACTLFMYMGCMRLQACQRRVASSSSGMLWERQAASALSCPPLVAALAAQLPDSHAQQLNAAAAQLSSA